MVIPAIPTESVGKENAILNPLISEEINLSSFPEMVAVPESFFLLFFSSKLNSTASFSLNLIVPVHFPSGSDSGSFSMVYLFPSIHTSFTTPSFEKRSPSVTTILAIFPFSNVPNLSDTPKYSAG